jgi:hypothetical protein
MYAEYILPIRVSRLMIRSGLGMSNSENILTAEICPPGMSRIW